MNCDNKATANGVLVAYVKEDICGVTPDNPQFQTIGIVSETLDRTVTTTESTEIYADRNVRDAVQTGVEIGGAIETEQRVKALRDFVVAGIQADAPLEIDATGDVTATAEPYLVDYTAMRVADPSGTLFADAQLGWYVATSGFSNESNNGVWRVVDRSDPTSVLLLSIDGDDPVDVGTPETVTISANVYTNGTTRQAFTIEKQFTDLAQTAYFRYTGMEIGEMSFNADSNAILTGSYSFVGRESNADETELSGAVYADPSTDPILNSISGVGEIFANGTPVAGDIISLAYTINNNSRGQSAIGTDGFVGVAHGSISVSGETSLYFENMDLYNAFVAEQHIELDFFYTDGARNRLVVSMPNVKYTALTVNATGTATDVVATGTFTALYDTPTAIKTVIDGTIQYSYFDA